MLQEHEKAQIQASLDLLREGIVGFRTRRPQLEMVAAVANALGVCYAPDEETRRGRSIAMVEAGTGTGKTVGYLVPAIVLAQSRGKHLVVSSSTLALQAQLTQKDLPALQRVTPVAFSYAVAKGRSRYACIAKLFDKAEEAKQGQTASIGENEREATSALVGPSLELLVQMATKFNEEGWSGDRDDLKLSVRDSVWREVVTDRQGCAGSKCPQFARCPYYAARQRVKEADVVIANHDLVLSALRMEMASVLPEPADTFYVSDEAHRLPTKAIEHFAAQHSLRGAAQWLADSAETAQDIVLALSLDETYSRDAAGQCVTLQNYLEELYQAIDSTKAFEEKRARRFKNGVLPIWGRMLGENILAVAQGLQKTLQALREAMLAKAQAEAHLVQRLLAALGFYLTKLANLIDTWEMMLRDDAGAESPTARWIEKYAGSSDTGDYLVCASPLSGANKLQRLLWNRASAAVLTSATLTSCGSFHLFMQQSGLARMPDARALKVKSPFDYERRAQLVIPPMKSDPKDAEAHTEEVIALLPKLMNTRGTLVLFASEKQMRAVCAQLPDAIRPIIRMQGALPKMEIVARHKAAIDRGDKSIIFGLASFAEGVDLPGEYCTHVIIAKLPFAVPDHPLEEARREWIEKQGRSAFIEITVPETGVRLAQAVGRLLRTDQDYGTVTILDRRLATFHWGHRLLQGLPPFRLNIGSTLRNAVCEART